MFRKCVTAWVMRESVTYKLCLSEYEECKKECKNTQNLDTSKKAVGGCFPPPTSLHGWNPKWGS